MPERRDYQLEERLEALVRFSAPGEFGNGFHDHEPAKAVPEGIVAGRRRKSPRSGGVIPPRDSKASWAVNIRPKNWGNKDKIWMGKIKSVEEAQRIADIVFHYLGCGPVHFLFPDAKGRPPPFLNDNLQLLDSVEKRMKYVKDIAKGDAFHARRKELMDSVKEMVKYLTARQDEVNFDLFTASCNAVYPFTTSCNIADPFAATCNIRSPPELGVERFDEAYGRRALSFDFPVLPQGRMFHSYVYLVEELGVFPLLPLFVTLLGSCANISLLTRLVCKHCNI